MNIKKIESPQRDKYGMYEHPQSPHWDGDTTKAEQDQWLLDHGFKMGCDYFESSASEELQNKWYEDGICDCSAWEPKHSNQDAILLCIFDTEDGPVAWFLLPDKG